MLKYNILIEGIIKEFTRIEPKHVSFIVNDSDGNEYQCFSFNIKKKLSVSDEVLLFGMVTSGNKIIISYIINKSKRTEEDLYKLKAKWRFYFSLILALIFLGTFIFLLISFSNLIPFTINVSFLGLEEIYTLIFKLTLLIPSIALAGIFGIISYSLFQNRKRATEIEKEKNRLKMAGIRPTQVSIKEKIKEVVIEPESPEEMDCPDCGEKLPLDAMFCSKCGKTI